MWVIFVAILLFRLIWWRHIFAYMQGMSLYRRKNWQGLRNEPRMMIASTVDEFHEIFEELHKGNYWDAYLEVWDVWHGVVNSTLMLIFGEWMMLSYPYFAIYFLVPFTAWKHGDRFMKDGCIRSKNWHKFENGQKIPIEHVCP